MKSAIESSIDTYRVKTAARTCGACAHAVSKKGRLVITCGLGGMRVDPHLGTCNEWTGG